MARAAHWILVVIKTALTFFKCSSVGFVQSAFDKQGGRAFATVKFEQIVWES